MSSDCRMIIFLGDGMGGRPLDELDGKTTLEAAETPNMDRVAHIGESGYLHPAGYGIPVGSDTAHMAMLGYDPHTQYRGRGPFEAKGVGLDVTPGDLAFRCNFATVEGRIVKDRRAGRIASGTDQLADAIMDAFSDGIDGVEVIFEESVEHRAALVLRGEGLDHRITEVDPHEPGVEYWDCKPLPEAEDDPDAIRSARIVNQFVERSREILEDHPLNKQRKQNGLLPANIVLPRGVGTAVHLPSLRDKHGLTGAMIVEVDLVRGLGHYVDMDVVHVEGATGGRDTDEIAIARAVVEAVHDHDFVLANIKAPDLGGHDGDPDGKMQAIRKVDRAVGHLSANLNWDNTVIMIGADHCTPCSLQDHSGDAIPVAFCGHGVRPDAVESYGERQCALGSIGHIIGSDVVPVLKNYADRQEKFGA